MILNASAVSYVLFNKPDAGGYTQEIETGERLLFKGNDFTETDIEPVLRKK